MAYDFVLDVPEKRVRSKGRNCSSVDSPDVLRDKEFWFIDGSIVLVASGVAFRVYKGLLAHHSDVFRDMFTVPLPEDEESIDGCPVVHLCDSSEDLRHLLRVIFHGGEWYRPNERLPFRVVAALARLSQKYQMERIRKEAVKRIKTCFCDDLKTWLEVCRIRGSSVMSFEIADAIEAVNLARLMNMDSMLPLALYLCCQLDTKYLVHGVARADGTTEQLHPDDVARCVEGRRHLLHCNVLMGMQISRRDVSYKCENREICMDCLECTNNGVWIAGGFDSRLDHCGVFDSWEQWIRKREINDLCENCNLMVRGRLFLAQQRVWMKLPQYMGVEDPPAPKKTSLGICN
ncbi:uncharacterized protein LAESUDRAFT_698022 [Laetiporus sulphureus 93-53]|uniref:BTB domain-containing protein n=1 Tax=Laetiporus sulphureus 93-53 TaxID=1314785 RepID=A0A165EY09_9APHY|nr:uncharacterized protein LAESUDRAFT_698022 [Laetiporus sulphureus 93-53]KZT07954.1 hypothetical protein LAESUDRAFT_698022 [Laetiporus sulphureus 93-53]